MRNRSSSTTKTELPPLRPGRRLQHWILPVLLGAGFLLIVFGPVDWRDWLELARHHAHSPWLVVFLVAVQIVMFSLALPASGLVWVVAPLYPPWLSTLILTTGGTLGALGAYFVSRHFGQRWRQRLEQRPLFDLLRRQGNFATLFALRVMPGFPHSVTSYSAGLLRLRLTPFIASAVIGLMCKTGLYSYAIWGAVGADEPTDLTRPGVVIPLLGLVLLAVAAHLYQARLARQRDDGV